MQIHWYPGHMTKTRRMMEKNLKIIDVVCEIVDARIPCISRNPDIDVLCAGKSRLMVLNKCDLADAKCTDRWCFHFKKLGYEVIRADSKRGTGVNKFDSAVRRLLEDKINSWNEKGQIGRKAKIMIVGIPNVGKSTFINKLIGKRSANAQDKPGVTRGKQWFSLSDGTDLLDTPGILWPKLEDEKTGIYLAVTGAVKDDILDVETLACKLFEILYDVSQESIIQRYKIEMPRKDPDFLGYELLQASAIKRGFLLPGQKADTLRMAKVFLDEYRGGVLGRITLEIPGPCKEG